VPDQGVQGTGWPDRADAEEPALNISRLCSSDFSKC
jgi:hypothetical protein